MDAARATVADAGRTARETSTDLRTPAGLLDAWAAVALAQAQTLTLLRALEVPRIEDDAASRAPNAMGRNAASCNATAGTHAMSCSAMAGTLRAAAASRRRRCVAPRRRVR